MYGPYGGAFADSGLFPYILTCMGRMVEHLQTLVYFLIYRHVWAVRWSICSYSLISLYIDMYGPYGGAFADSGLFPYILTCMGRMVEHLQTLVYFLIYRHVWAVWWSICSYSLISLCIDMYGPYGGAFADSCLFPYILTCLGRMVEHLQTLVYFLIY